MFQDTHKEISKMINYSQNSQKSFTAMIHKIVSQKCFAKRDSQKLFTKPSQNEKPFQSQTFKKVSQNDSQNQTHKNVSQKETHKKKITKIIHKMFHNKRLTKHSQKLFTK